jgi:son of sevenless-like protein
VDIDPLEIARQLTLMESQMYQRIKPVEVLNKNWGEKENSRAVNIKAMIETSNRLTAWVTEMILSEKEIRKRCTIIKHFTSVAEKCRVLYNFNTLMSILAGLNSSPIHRLKRTWEAVPQRTTVTLDSLKKTMNPTKNFVEYRDILHSVNPPCVPFLGVYLTDLTFIDDGNPDQLREATHLINFSKRAKTADVIREIQQYQASPYNLHGIPEIQQFLRKHIIGARDQQELYDLSLEMEPKEKEDEKIARLLHESGFL